jgi:hypothetical protein
MLAALTPRQLRALFAPNHHFVQRNEHRQGPGRLADCRCVSHGPECSYMKHRSVRGPVLVHLDSRR